MNKFDLYRDEKSIYRILSIQKKILVIDCKKRSMPYFVDAFWDLRSCVRRSISPNSPIFAISML